MFLVVPTNFHSGPSTRVLSIHVYCILSMDPYLYELQDPDPNTDPWSECRSGSRSLFKVFTHEKSTTRFPTQFKLIKEIFFNVTFCCNLDPDPNFSAMLDLDPDL
jgi:hypothetical protein